MATSTPATSRRAPVWFWTRSARDLAVSPVPVREALRMLEAEGLVEFERNVGARVRMVETAEYEHTMQALAIVEGAATGLSAPSVRAEDLRRARSANQKLRQCLDDFDLAAFTRKNREFHEALFCRCPNPQILDLVVRGWQRLQMPRQSTFSSVPERARQSIDEHDALLELIESHADPLDIEVATRRHRLNTLQAMREYQLAHLGLTERSAVERTGSDSTAALYFSQCQRSSVSVAAGESDRAPQ
ncbi:GntR family transcriptional regulator [Micromonospora sp. KC606]|uniref:GntR family transcriptional regulator n=1 Tax=Micromonospora sp. KC606 TaxID=2530379 RepID=UPI002441D7F7|nr:GntR family transcriptional regulator [Micromonospora sp. KC606]